MRTNLRFGDDYLGEFIAGLDDPVALNVAWAPVSATATNVRTHHLVEVSPVRAEFRPTVGGRFVAALIVGIGFWGWSFGISAARGASGSGVERGFILTFSGLWGAVFVALGVGIWCWISRSRVFDLQDGWYRHGKRANRSDTVAVSDEAVRLERVHAVQIVSELFTRDTRRSYELNLVIDDGQRVQVVNHGCLAQIQQDAAHIGRLLDVPVWDATTVARSPEEGGLLQVLQHLGEDLTGWHEARLNTFFERVDDPVAKRTAWTPVRTGLGGFAPDLIKVSPTRFEYEKVRLPVSVGAMLLIASLALLGFGIAVRIAGDPFGIVLVLFGLVFSALFTYPLVAPDRTPIFDLQHGYFWRGARPESGSPNTKHAMALNNLYAVQMIVELRYSGGQSGFEYLYELNLVSADAGRVPVICHGSGEKLRVEGRTIAEALGVPFWDATN